MEKVKVEEEEEKVMSLLPALEAPPETSPDPLVDVVIQLEQQLLMRNLRLKAAKQHLSIWTLLIKKCVKLQCFFINTVT